MDPADDALSFTFDDALRARLADNLAKHERAGLELDEERHRRAAVAVVVVDSDADAHGDDPHPLGLYDDPLMARVLAGEPAVLRAPPIRAWLRGYHREP